MDDGQVHELWQVDVNGDFFDTNFAELADWIDQGTVLRHNKVRKGNLRWIEAGKVPSLIAFFNAKDTGQPMPPVVTTTNVASPSLLTASSEPPPATPVPAVVGEPKPPHQHLIPPSEPMCSMHDDTRASYVCDTCGSLFCKVCPNSYGATVKVCPFCGAMCSSLAEAGLAQTPPEAGAFSIAEGFGFGDFINALAYPFRFKASLFFGAVMFMFFSIGQSVVGFGGVFMMAPAIICFMLANTLSFGVLANTVENFSQGKLDQNFMPSFDDFSLWDDVVHPFFLSIGVYISSFGPFLAVVLAAVFMVMGTVSKEMNGLQSDAARAVKPDLPYAAGAARQGQAVREILQKKSTEQESRLSAVEGADVDPDNLSASNAAANEEEEFARLNQMIQDHRKAQLESAVGKTPESVATEQAQLVSKILDYGAIFVLAAGVCLLWGLFYFPAACAVAGYTRSFTATLNPTVGLDTIRRLGGTYVKILLMGIAIILMSSFVSGIVGGILSPFDMPSVGNMPAKAIGSLFGFYFSVVFSCVLGFALYKTADRLRLYR